MIADGDIDLNGDLKEIFNEIKRETDEIIDDDKIARTM
jgi:hypothetical protein